MSPSVPGAYIAPAPGQGLSREATIGKRAANIRPDSPNWRENTGLRGVWTGRYSPHTKLPFVTLCIHRSEIQSSLGTKATFSIRLELPNCTAGALFSEVGRRITINAFPIYVCVRTRPGTLQQTGKTEITHRELAPKKDIIAHVAGASLVVISISIVLLPGITSNSKPDVVVSVYLCGINDFVGRMSRCPGTTSAGNSTICSDT